MAETPAPQGYQAAYPTVLGKVSLTNNSIPVAIAYDSGKGEVFVAGSAAVSVINDSTNTIVATIPFCSCLTGLAYDPSKGEVFVSGYSMNVSVISDATNTVVATVPPFAGWGASAGWGLAYDPARGEVFLANGGGQVGMLLVINDTSDTVVTLVKVGTTPYSVAYDPSKGEIFVTNTWDHTVSIVNDSTNRVVATVWSGLLPWGMVYVPAKGEMFIGNVGGYNVTVMNDSTDTATASVQLSGPEGDQDGLAYDPRNGMILVTESDADQVVEISQDTQTVVAAVDLLLGADAVAFDTGHSTFYVACSDASSVSVVSGGGMPVVVHENGLPAKVLEKDLWRADLSGVPRSGGVSSLYFFWVLPGVYPYLVVGPAGWRIASGSPVNGASGSLVVGPGTYTESVVFVKGMTYTLTFAETGLPRSGTTVQTWCAAVQGNELCSFLTRVSLRFSNLSGGTYSYSVLSPLTGQNITQKVGSTVVYGPNGSIALTGSVTVRLTFTYEYAVTFTETGLPVNATKAGSGGGMNWSITAKGTTKTAPAGTPIVLELKNGTYAYKIGAATGYTSTGSPQPVMVNGGPASVTVTFKAKT